MSILPGEDFRIFVETRFQNEFFALYPTIPVKFKEPFRQPTNSPWVVFWILPGTSFKANLGRTFVRRTPGLLQMDILVPEATGHAVADMMAEQAGTIFADRNFSIAYQRVARFREPQITALGSNGGFYRCNARVIYEHDAIMVDPNN